MECPPAPCWHSSVGEWLDLIVWWWTAQQSIVLHLQMTGGGGRRKKKNKIIKKWFPAWPVSAAACWLHQHRQQQRLKKSIPRVSGGTEAVRSARLGTPSHLLLVKEKGSGRMLYMHKKKVVMRRGSSHSLSLKVMRLWLVLLLCDDYHGELLEAHLLSPLYPHSPPCCAGYIIHLVKDIINAWDGMSQVSRNNDFKVTHAGGPNWWERENQRLQVAFCSFLV